MSNPLLQEYGFEPASAQEATPAQPPQPVAQGAAPAAAPAAPGMYGQDGMLENPEGVTQPGSVMETAGRVVKDVATGVLEAPTALGHGAVEAVNEMSNTAHDLAKFADRYVPLGSIEITREGFKWKPGVDDRNVLQVPNVLPDPTSVTGGVVDGVSQFITSYALGGKLLKMIRGGVAATTAGKMGESAVKTAFAGAAGFDPSEARLSNLIEENPTLSNPITQFLAASPDDSRALGRFKNSLEQLGLNMPLEGIFYAVKGLKAKRAGDLEAAETAAGSAQRAFLAWREADALAKGEVLDTGGTGKAPPPKLVVDALEHSQQTGMYGVPGGAVEVTPKAPKYKPPEFDQQELLDTFYLARGNYGTNLDTFAGSIVGKNMSRVNNEEDAKAFFNVLATTEEAAFAKAKGRPRTLAEIEKEAADSFEKLADYTGTDVGQLRVRMAADVKNLNELANRVAGYRMGVEVYSNRAASLARSIIARDASEFGGDLTKLHSEFLATAQTLLSIAPLSEGVKSGLGRNLSLLRANVGPGQRTVGALPTHATPDNPAMQADLVNALGGGDAAIERLAKRLALADNPKLAKKVVDDAFGPGAFDVVNEYWINALLSGPKTHMVNMLTSSLKSALVMPTEQLVAGMMQGDVASMRMAADQYYGFYASMREAMTKAAQAMRQADPVLDPTHMGLSNSRRAITADTFGLQTDTPLGMLVEGLGNMARLPGRLLTTEDEFLKQLNYRARLHSLAMREVREMKKAHGMSDEEAGRFYAEFLERGYDPNGRGINEEALAYARDATFTNDLDVPSQGGGKSLGQSVNEMANNHPGLRMVVPFTRVPINILRDAWDHTPGLNMLRKAYREELSAGGERRAIASAKMATGGALWTAAIMMAANGDITGGLSSDPVTRKLEQESGKQPNSLRFFDENGKPYYIEYARLDPYATFFSIAATVAEAGGHMNDWEFEDLAGSLAVGLAKNIESKTYLQGLINWMGALADPDRRGSKMVQQHAASFVPSVTNAFKGADYLSDARNIADAMLARTPGHPGVDRRYNIVGEPVQTPKAFGPTWLSPFALSPSDRQDPMLAEIARLSQVHKGGIAYSPKERGGVDLTEIGMGDKTAFARFQELTGEVRIGGLTLRERLTQLFNSDQYKKQFTDGEPGFPGSRLEQVQAILQGYREGATRQLMNESPEFKQMWIMDQQKKFQTLRFGKQP